MWKVIAPLALAAVWPWLAFAEPVLDASFGNNGVVDVALPGESYLNPAHVAVLPDLRIAVARTNRGQPGAGAALTASFARLLPDGRLDASFGTGGTTTFVLQPGPINYAAVNDIHVRADGSQLVSILVAADLGGPFVQVDTLLLGITADGRFDPAFNGGQPVRITDYDGQKLFVDGGTMLVVRVDSELCCDNHTQLIARRVRADGTPDATFGTGGVLEIESTQAQTQIRDAMPVPGGGFQVLYRELTSPGERTFWRRYRANGSLDTTFGANGDADLPVFNGFGIRRVHPLGDGTWLATEGGTCGRRVLDEQGSIVDTLDSACSPALAQTGVGFGAQAWGHRILMHGKQATGFISLPSDGPYVWAVDRDGRIDAAFAYPQDIRWLVPGPRSASYGLAVDGTDRFVLASAEYAVDSVRVQRYVDRRGGSPTQPIPVLGLPGLLLLLGGAAVLARQRLARC